MFLKIVFGILSKVQKTKHDIRIARKMDEKTKEYIVENGISLSTVYFIVQIEGIIEGMKSLNYKESIFCWRAEMIEELSVQEELSRVEEAIDLVNKKSISEHGNCLPAIKRRRDNLLLELKKQENETTAAKEIINSMIKS